jgi:hypothetical protein
MNIPLQRAEQLGLPFSLEVFEVACEEQLSFQHISVRRSFRLRLMR